MEGNDGSRSERLVKDYAFRALKGLNLAIEAGEVFCLLGANGAGKTTTIQLFLDSSNPPVAQPV